MWFKNLIKYIAFLTKNRTKSSSKPLQPKQGLNDFEGLGGKVFGFRVRGKKSNYKHSLGS